MKIEIVKNNTPKKIIKHILKQRKINNNSNVITKATNQAVERNCALKTLERNALDMKPEDYIAARSYLASLERESFYYNLY
ncbi:MAG: hypothetical protein ACI37Q_02850 [Candidatus Gastranaerophilaceae bacterium]